MTLVVDVTCKGSDRSRRFVLEDGQELEIGRANEDLNLAADPRLSRQHFILRYLDRQIEIRHLSRTNPTMVASRGCKFTQVNGTRTEEDSCRIIAGSHQIVLTLEEPDSVIAPTFSPEEHEDRWSELDSEGGSEDDQDWIKEGGLTFTPEIGEGDDQLNELPVELERPDGPRAPITIVDRPDSKSDHGAEEKSGREPASPVSNPRDNGAVSASGTKKKLFFPIADDFFED